MQLQFREGRLDRQRRPKLVRKGELRARRAEYGWGGSGRGAGQNIGFVTGSGSRDRVVKVIGMAKERDVFAGLAVRAPFPADSAP